VAKEKVLDYSCEAGDRNLGEVKILPREPSPEIEARKVNLKADVAAAGLVKRTRQGVSIC
jgi:hypothetical protein